MAELTREQWEAAKTRGDERLRGPRVVSARYDAGRGWVIVRLTAELEIGFSPQDAEGLQHATWEDLRTVEVDAFGLGVHFSRLDADLYVPALLEGLLGSEAWTAARAETVNDPRKASSTPARRHAIENAGPRRRVDRPA